MHHLLILEVNAALLSQIMFFTSMLDRSFQCIAVQASKRHLLKSDGSLVTQMDPMWATAQKDHIAMVEEGGRSPRGGCVHLIMLIMVPIIKRFSKRVYSRP